MKRIAMGTMALPALAIALVLSATASFAAPTDAQKCEAAKLGAQAKLAKCRLKADAKYAKKLDAAKRAAGYAKCADRLANDYTAIEGAYGGACPTSGDDDAVDAFLQGCTEKARDWTAGGLSDPLVFERLSASG